MAIDHFRQFRSIEIARGYGQDHGFGVIDVQDEVGVVEQAEDAGCGPGQALVAVDQRVVAGQGAGTSLVLYGYGGQQLDYFDRSDAVDRWQSVRYALTSREPRLGGDVVWTGGRWVSDGDQEMLLLTGQC